MQQRAVRARKKMCVQVFLRRLWSGHSALSPSRLLAKLCARARRLRLAGAVAEHEAAEASEPNEAWAVTAAERRTVEAAWASGSATQLLALDEDTGLQLTRRDLRTLHGSSWLNDEARSAQQRVHAPFTCRSWLQSGLTRSCPPRFAGCELLFAAGGAARG